MHFIQKLIKPYSFSTVLLSVRQLSDVTSASKELSKNLDVNLQVNSTDDVIQFQNALFNTTRRKQLSDLVPRLEKIEVHYQGRGISDSAVMFMNKHLSTPHHCAMQHAKFLYADKFFHLPAANPDISKTVADSAVLAVVVPTETTGSSTALTKPLEGTELVDDQHAKEESIPQPVFWDIHRPIPYNCKIEILKFNMENSSEWYHEQVNRAYWNSCSLILGAVMQQAFKKNYEVGFYHLPRVSEKSGAFCYDIMLDEKLSDWKPSDRDLVYFTKVARSLISGNFNFERLEVEPQIAFKMFDNDRHQCERIQNILDVHGEDTPIVLYRVGQYIDISDGPHIANTSLMYHYVVVAFHRLFCGDEQNIRRVQGISLPKDLRVQHAVWSVLENRARKLVKKDFKFETTPETLENRRASLPFESIENKTKQYMISTGQWRDGSWKGTKKDFKSVEADR